MPASAWLGCLLSLAWAVAGLKHQDGGRPGFTAPTDRFEQPVADARSSVRDDERLAHLQQAEAHLQAAGLEGLIPVLEESLRREVLLDQLADKVGQLRELQQDIAHLRQRITATTATSSSPAEDPLAQRHQIPVKQILVQLRILEIPRGKLGALNVADRRPDGSDQAPRSVQVETVSDPSRLAQVLETWRASGRARVLAEPRLVTVSGRPATISSGGAIPVPVVRADNQVTMQYRHVGTRLDVVPVALGNGMIRLALRAEVSELEDRSRRIAAPDGSAAVTRVRTVDTALELAPGQTVAIGGLIQSGELAVPGNDNQETSPAKSSQEGTELIVLATAELVGAPDLPAMRQAARQVPLAPSPPALARPFGPAPVQLAPALRSAP